MKTFICFLVLCLCRDVYAQQIIPEHQKIISYKVTLKDTKGRSIKGYLFGFTDSAVLLLPYDFTKSSIRINSHEICDSYSYTDIVKIKFRRKNSTVRGILFGGITGTAVGTIIGAIVGEQTRISKGEGGWLFPYIPPGTKIVTESAGLIVFKYSFVAAAAGEIIGGTIGLFSSRNFTINGSKKYFDSTRNSMIKKMYR